MDIDPEDEELYEAYLTGIGFHELTPEEQEEVRDSLDFESYKELCEQDDYGNLSDIEDEDELEFDGDSEYSILDDPDYY